MRYSDNYNLKLPQRGVDRANVDDLDSNFETIDGALADDRQIGLLMYDSTATYNTGAIRGYENPTTHRIRAYRCLEDNVTGPWDATKWAQTTLAAEIEAGGGGGGSSTLAGLSDVDLGTLADGEVLTYNATEGKWVNAEGGGASELSDLDDVSLTTPSDGQVLTYDDGDWVNKDLPAVTKTATGNPIEITDGANAPLVKCVTQITGYQSGTGTPSPDNVRPITAYTEGEIEVRGKNLANFVNGKGIGNDGLPDDSANRCATTTPIYVKSGETYIFTSEDGSKCIYSVWDGLTLKRRTSNIPSGTSLNVSDGDRFYVCAYNDSTATVETSKPMVRVSTSDSSYEPYTSTTHTTTYPSAIYRGSEDVVEGEVSAENLIFDLSDVDTWYPFTLDNHTCVRSNITTLKTNYENIICTHLYVNTSDNYINGTFRNRSWNAYNFEIELDGITTDAEMKAWLASQVSNGNPVLLAYKLATPTTSSVTPTNLPIKSLNGYNHIESSTGEMEIEYITQKYQPIVDLISESSGGDGYGETTLWESVSGTHGQITLSDNLSNYDAICVIMAPNNEPTYRSSPIIPVSAIDTTGATHFGIYVSGATSYCSSMTYVDDTHISCDSWASNYPMLYFKVVGIKYGGSSQQTVTLTRSLSKGTTEKIEKKPVEEEKKEVDEKSEELTKEVDKLLDEQKEELTKEPSEPISEPSETKTDSLSKDETELKEEDESKEIEDVTEEPTEEPTEEEADER